LIPKDYITEWREHAPWVQDAQVEQDLVISRALIEIFRVPEIAARLAFRGGTALYKLHLRPAARYSEDIDLVQVAPGPSWSMHSGVGTADYRFVWSMGGENLEFDDMDVLSLADLS
jgi:Nucleotidyl transferase AbiEii toxin, Type IV TA system